MKKIIHHIRKQPEETRRHILHITIVVAGVILLFLWVYSLGASFADEDARTRTENDLKPFSALKSNIIDGYEVILEPNF